MMARVGPRVQAGLLIGLLATGTAAGCGGGGREAMPKTAAPASAEPKPHHDGGGSAQFEQPGGDNSIQRFGSEAGQAEFEAAAAALHGFFDARAERDWAAVCNYLSKDQKSGFARIGGCAKAMQILSGAVPTSDLREAAIANVGSLRREGTSGFLIYRGAGGAAYAIPVAKESEGWRIAALAGTPLS